MKKSIQGFRYDSEKAIFVGTAIKERHWIATLYKTTRAGRYFLMGEGDAGTMFTKKTGRLSKPWTMRIIPMKEEEAKNWARANLSWEVFMKHFENVEV